MNFIVLKKNKILTIAGILTIVSMINTASESLKARKFLIFSILDLITSCNSMLIGVGHEKVYPEPGRNSRRQFSLAKAYVIKLSVIYVLI